MSREASESEGDSEDSGSDGETDPGEPSPLPPNRPTDPKKAIEYDLIKAVWARRSSNLTGEQIRTSLGECWNVIKSVRDSWKTEVTKLQEAESMNQQTHVVLHQRAVVEQRQIMERAIQLMVEYAHRDIVEQYVLSFLCIKITLFCISYGLWPPFPFQSRSGIGSTS